MTDVEGHPGDLPLLQLALTELWEHDADSGVLRKATYEALGSATADGEALGVRGVIARLAEDQWQRLRPDERAAATRVLVNLIAPAHSVHLANELGQAARRAWQLEWDEATRAVGDELVGARLLSTGTDPASGEPTVEVAHEALIWAWPRLRRLADTYGEFVRWYGKDCAPWLQRWEQGDRSQDLLLRGALLQTAEHWLATVPELLVGPCAEFIRVSAEERVQAARRRTRRLRILASGSTAVAVLVAGISLWALDQRSDARRQTAEARHQAAQATSLALASSASSLLDSRPDVALLLALEAYRASPRAEARNVVLGAQAAARDPGVLGILHGHTDAVVSVAVSRDGRTAASAGLDKTIRLWDVRTHEQLGAPLTGHTDAVFSVAFNPDGRTLASAGADKTIRLWDVRTHEQLGAPLTGHSDAINSVAFNRDGRTVASAGGDSIRLWDVRSHAQLGAPLTRQSGDAVAFSPDGRTLASADANKIRLWDMRKRMQLGVPLTGHTEDVFSVAFSRDGRTLASAGLDKTIRLWDVRTGELLGAPLTGHTSAVLGLAFSDARKLASASFDQTVRLWDVRGRKPRGVRLPGYNTIDHVVGGDREILPTSDRENSPPLTLMSR